MRASRGDLSRDVDITENASIGILCSPAHLKDFVDNYGLKIQKGLRAFSEELSSSQAGIAEIVIPPGSSLIGKSARDVWMRKTYGLSTVALHRDGKTLFEGDNIRDMPFEAGDTLLVHTKWRDLARLRVPVQSDARKTRDWPRGYRPVQDARGTRRPKPRKLRFPAHDQNARVC